MSPKCHQFVIGEASTTEELRVAAMLFHDPIRDRRAITSPCPGQIEDVLGMLIQVVLATDRLDIVAIEQTATEPAVQFANQVLLPPRIKMVHVLWVQSRRVRIGHDSDRLETSVAERSDIRFGLLFGRYHYIEI